MLGGGSGVNVELVDPGDINSALFRSFPLNRGSQRSQKEPELQGIQEKVRKEQKSSRKELKTVKTCKYVPFQIL